MLRTLLALVACASPLAAQSVWHVRAGAPPGGDGSSWAQAFDSLDRGLAAAALLDAVWVAEGVYRPTRRLIPSDPRSATFLLPQGVQLYGGFEGHEQSLDERAGKFRTTVLDGDLGVPGDASDNAYNVVRVYFGPGIPPAWTRVDGFTITGGNADMPGTGLDTTMGGGVLVFNSALWLVDCIVTGNRALRGGGVHAQVGALAMLRCTLTDNQAEVRGGGLASNGTRIWSIHNTFARNRAPRGGAIFLASSQSNPEWVQIAGNLFHENHAERGGAIFLGGGPQSPGRATMRNCTLVMNTATVAGGGVHAQDVDSLIQSRVYNSILWRNAAPEGAQLHGNHTVSDSNVFGGASGSNNFSADPLFLDLAQRDFRLGPGSPCIDAGDNSHVPLDHLDADGNGIWDEPLPIDLAGQPRFADDPATPNTGSGIPPIVDLGAYEFQP